jgi:hypothetical protein
MDAAKNAAPFNFIVSLKMELSYYTTILIYSLVVSLVYLYILRGKIRKQYQFVGISFLLSVGVISIISIIRESLLIYYNFNLKITCPETPTFICDLGGFIYAWGFIPMVLFWLAMPPIINNFAKNIWLKAYGK